LVSSEKYFPPSSGQTDVKGNRNLRGEPCGGQRFDRHANARSLLRAGGGFAGLIADQVGRLIDSRAELLFRSPPAITRPLGGDL
jgi:hypothetical protein